MSDREQLAARLVEAARQAQPLPAPSDEGTVGEQLHRNADNRARAVTAAVLRGLASCRDNPPFPAPPVHWEYFTTGELNRLADYIEKGAGDGQH